jgi:hypothetical protein
LYGVDLVIVGGAALTDPVAGFAFSSAVSRTSGAALRLALALLVTDHLTRRRDDLEPLAPAAGIFAAAAAQIHAPATGALTQRGPYAPLGGLVAVRLFPRVRLAPDI